MSNVVCVTFDPNSPQEQFLRGMRPGGEGLFCAGVGIGKTELLAFCAQRLAHLNPGIPGLVVSHVLNHVIVETVPRIIGYLKRFGTYMGMNKQRREIYVSNGAVIQYGGANRPDTMDGKDVGWGLADEDRHWPYESYQVFTARIRQACPFPYEGHFTTPEMNWVYDSFAHRDDILLVRGSTYDNAHNLQPGYIDKLERNLHPKMLEQYMLGKWVVMGGAAFPEFDREIHVVEGLADGVREVQPLVDFGGKHAVVYLDHLDWCEQHGTTSCFHIVGEWMPDGLATYQLPTELRGNLRSHRWRPGTCIVDKAGNNNNPQTNRRDIELMEQGGFECQWTTEPENVSIRNGIDKIRALLKPVKGPPRLYFDASLVGGYRGVIEGLERAELDKSNTKYLKDGVLEHALDALRYGIIAIEPPVDTFAGVV